MAADFIAPVDFVPDQIVTDAELNEILENLRFFYNRPRVKATRVASLSVANSSATLVPWTSEEFDNADLHSNSTNNTRLTANISGAWLIYAGLVWADNSTGVRFAGFRFNGGSYRGRCRRDAASTSEDTLTTSLLLNAGDYVELEVLQSSGGALDLTSSLSTFFGMTWLGS